MTILVTGCNGMIGSSVVSALLKQEYNVVGVSLGAQQITNDHFKFYSFDLTNKDAIECIFNENNIDMVIHLAALAHKTNNADLSWKNLYKANVECAVNVFTIAAKSNIPVLFSSTVDVYGIIDYEVDTDSKCEPVSDYAKTKYLAELRLKEIYAGCNTYYSIMRLAPVYTDMIKRDIQKRYYIRYPNWAYKIGSGMEYEVLYIDNLVNAILEWVVQSKRIAVQNIKDPDRMKTASMLNSERLSGHAKHIIHVPKCLVVSFFYILRFFFPRKEITYLLSKAIKPIRTK